MQEEVHAVFRCQFAPVTALREEFAGLFAWLPASPADLHRFMNGNDPCAVASFISKLMSLCEGA